ncbi:MAG: glycosyltransferase family 39 protein [Candidatus Omnitrophica bacterium]|nr:glycosyltransferase family 39 protein [Candidatus Omnitrophota bacterium]
MFYDYWIVNDFRKKLAFFVITAGVIISSYLADFCLPGTIFYRFQQICFWPTVLVLVLWLIPSKKGLTFQFSRYSIALFFILLIGLFFRLYKINTLPLNHDEAHTTLRTLFLFQNKDFVSYAGVPITFLNGKVPALFSLLAVVSAKWFINPEIIVRLPSIIIGILTIWFVYRLVKELGERKTALLSAFFLAILPWHIIQSRVGVNAILTPCFGALFFLLFAKAIKKESYKYFYLSFFVLGIAAFWTYTASQVYVILAVICCIVFRKELSWMKKIDFINSILLFIIPLHPFLIMWGKVNFVHSQYYHSVSLFHNNLILNAIDRLKDAFILLFWAEDPFSLFAPGFAGPIIQPFLLISLVFGFLSIQKNPSLARVVRIWLIGGMFFLVCFISEVADRYIIAVAPALCILMAYGVLLSKFKRLIPYSVAAAIIGIWIYGSSYFGYLNKIPLGSLKAYSYGCAEVSRFLSEDALFMKSGAKAAIEWRMIPAEFYFILAKRRGQDLFEKKRLNKFIPCWGDDLAQSKDVVFYCLWSPESRGYDWDAFNCQLYKKFRLFYPEKLPVKVICYPDGKKAIEIFKMEQ